MQHELVSATSALRPRIGVTSADDPAPDNYVAAVERCGGTAIILPNDIDALDELLAGLDGLLITGGSDIDPIRYASKAHAETKPSDPARDDFELAIVLAAYERNLPTLAVCRGLQVANVAWGGTLNQHLPDLVDGSVVHDDASRKFTAFDEHIVDVVSDSLLYELTQSKSFPTNATHHQSVGFVGEGLRVVARTSDGVIEALERPEAQSFWLATQWHPERLLDVDQGRSERIFGAFIAASRKTGVNKQLPV